MMPPVARKPASLVLGKTSANGRGTVGGFADVESAGVTLRNKPATMRGVPRGVPLTMVRLQRSVVAVGIGGYLAP